MDTLTLTLRFRFFVLLLGLLITTIAIGSAAYYQVKLDVRELATVAAAGLALTALIYSALAFHANLSLNERKLLLDKQQVALNLISEWHSPEMAKLNLISYVLKKETSELESTEVVALLKSDASKREAIVSILNFFEKAALAIHINMADEAALKDFFTGIVRVNYNVLKGFIEYKRKEHNYPQAFSRFEELAKRWNA